MKALLFLIFGVAILCGPTIDASVLRGSDLRVVAKSHVPRPAVKEDFPTCRRIFNSNDGEFSLMVETTDCDTPWWEVRADQFTAFRVEMDNLNNFIFAKGDDSITVAMDELQIFDCGTITAMTSDGDSVQGEISEERAAGMRDVIWERVRFGNFGPKAADEGHNAEVFNERASLEVSLLRFVAENGLQPQTSTPETEIIFQVMDRECAMSDGENCPQEGDKEDDEEASHKVTSAAFITTEDYDPGFFVSLGSDGIDVETDLKEGCAEMNDIVKETPFEEVDMISAVVMVGETSFHIPRTHMKQFWNEVLVSHPLNDASSDVVHAKGVKMHGCTGSTAPPVQASMKDAVRLAVGDFNHLEVLSSSNHSNGRSDKKVVLITTPRTRHQFQ